MHGGEKECRKTPKSQKGDVIVLLKNKHQGVVLVFIGFGFWMLVGLLSFFTKNPSEIPSIHYHQRHDIRNTEDCGRNNASENPAPIFILLFQDHLEKSENKSLKDEC